MKQVTDIEDYEEALRFLEEGLKTNKNPKPVGQHSIDVANRLLSWDLDNDVVIAGLLHDLIEDTDVEFGDIKNNFSPDIAKLVDAVTYDVPGADYKDKYSRFLISVDKVLSYGEDAIYLEAADFIENSPYYKLADTDELKSYLKKKYEYFIDKATPRIKKEAILNDLDSSYRRYVENLI
ncbi:MAG TPA: HD domain-containing protein [Candidatus Saccharimonadales bacterium]|nr:HD domain-containing protein [Candidatus Saccharimonadales bacterium]